MDDVRDERAGGETVKRFPTVGIGTSAGGVQALQTFFKILPDDVDAAFVVIVHLDPGHQSELPKFLATRTSNAYPRLSAGWRSNPATFTSFRPTASCWRPITTLRLPSLTSRAAARADRHLFPFARGTARRRLCRHSFRRGLMVRLASKRSRKPEASSWFKTRTRRNMDRCRATQSRPAWPILSCPIEAALPYQFGARTTFAIEPDGVHCTIALPLSGPQTEKIQNGQFGAS